MIEFGRLGEKTQQTFGHLEHLKFIIGTKGKAIDFKRKQKYENEEHII